jgi:hypothetical protein
VDKDNGGDGFAIGQDELQDGEDDSEQEMSGSDTEE